MKLKDQISIGLLIPGMVCFLGALIVFYALQIHIERPLKDQEHKNVAIASLIEKVRAQEETLTPEQQAEKMSALFALDQSSRELTWVLVDVVKYLAIALFSAGVWQLWLTFYVRRKLASKGGMSSSD